VNAALGARGGERIVALLERPCRVDHDARPRGEQTLDLGGNPDVGAQDSHARCMPVGNRRGDACAATTDDEHLEFAMTHERSHDACAERPAATDHCDELCWHHSRV
jgi:hypothetical protein